MKKNLGSADKTIRFILAVVVGVLYFTNIITGTFAIIVGALAIVFLLTSFLSYCPLYVPFKINTRGDK